MKWIQLTWLGMGMLSTLPQSASSAFFQNLMGGVGSNNDISGLEQDNVGNGADATVGSRRISMNQTADSNGTTISPSNQASDEVLLDEEMNDLFCGGEALQKIPFDSYVHKHVYHIGVHAVNGIDRAAMTYERAIGVYLTETAGKLFDPPIEFVAKAYYFDDLFNAIDNEEIDFFFANPGVYSCIGTQVGATALATVVKRLNVRNQVYDLDVYGGVIIARRENHAINNIQDLKDKVIGAGAIIDLMGGQMQIYEMTANDMSYVLDPKQVVFTKDQVDVVLGVMSGRFDVGFVRTAQIQETKDGDGNLVDPDLFKVIEPKMYVMDDGEMFPFIHSTSILPEWPFAALKGIPAEVQRSVQKALMDFGHMEKFGTELIDCLNSNAENYCAALDPWELYSEAPCYATAELGLLAQQAQLESNIVGWRPARSYFELRDIQESLGFLEQDSRNNWYCIRPSNLHEGITCPSGYYKRGRAEFEAGCNNVGLHCDDNADYDCFCKPCVKSNEVNVYEHVQGEDDPHDGLFFGDALPGCDKMSICGTIEQGESITLRIYDNEERPNPKVEVRVHTGDQEKAPEVRKLDFPYAYEFTVSDRMTQVQVIDILFDGVPISHSPVRVVVQDKDCEAVFGLGSGRVPDADGNCVCDSSTYEMSGTCLKSTYFFLIIFASVFIALGVLLFAYLGYKKQQNDSVWHINPEELHFNEPPEVIGQGGFGVVILGQYRGTKVAVKRVLPPAKIKAGHSGSLSKTLEEKQPGSIEIGTGSQENLDNIKQKTGSGKKKTKDSKSKTKDKNVKFDEAKNSGDIESQSFSNSGQRMASTSGSGRSWERLLTGFHSDNDVLRILDSATASDHGSDAQLMTTQSSRSTQVLLRMLPMWSRFDEHSRKVNEFIVEMRMLSRLRHPCITTVMGAVISHTTDPMLVMEFMEYGSLHDLLNNDTMTAGGEIILQIIRDIVQGMHFLHASKPPILHGDLKARNILVDSRFRAKVADFGFSHVKSSKQRNVLQGTPFYMAPEYLRRRSEYTTSCDIYSFAMILYEIYARASPFDGEDPRKVLPKVCHPRINKRPHIPEAMPPKIVELMKKCWSANAFFRPSAKDIDYVLVEMSMNDTEPLETVQENIRDNLKRKPTSLFDVFPKHIADALNAGKKVEAESHDCVTIVFSDIVGFTTISERFPPMKIANMLDRLYQAFDAIADKNHIFKVETIGDAYMGVTNLDGSEYETHVKQVAEYAQDIIRASSQILIDEDDPSMGFVQIRVGFHSGPVVSNVIGTLNPRYGLFGDTVNTASRMESNSMPGRIHCSSSSAQLLKQQAPDIALQLRGIIRVKGKGKMKTFWVGGDELLSAKPLESLAWANENTNHQDLEEDLSDSQSHSESHTDECRPMNPRHEADEKASIGTHTTHSLSIGCSRDSAKKDHFIKIHCEDGYQQQARIHMDGSVSKESPTSSSPKPVY